MTWWNTWWLHVGQFTAQDLLWPNFAGLPQVWQQGHIAHQVVHDICVIICGVDPNVVSNSSIVSKQIAAAAAPPVFIRVHLRV